MKKFSEWLEQRNLEEGSLGLQRRNRVAVGMAKRSARANSIFSPSDSYGHEVTDQLHKDVQATSGRFDRADQNMRDRSKARLQAIAKGDKEGRQTQAGPGNVNKIRANMDASRDANSALAKYNQPDVLAQRGKDPNWAANGGGMGINSLAQSPIGRAAANLSQAQADRNKEIQKTRQEDKSQNYSAAERRKLDREYSTAAMDKVRNQQASLDRALNPPR
jgi:hypothetical protein